ncbi:GerMN domain-containing protein [Evansella tamaricis]|uniref:GerMN domain-containing protein n=1 Tax=Evansella tamaricis TaxID=2069301 RepID=A0ABS6JAE4_9BACI|nr:GerMN domain-containing protein [Evansella tamaricis]MBU9710415.1 GerMN domain-containing protein [Evansella tamaricis]
MTRKSGWDEEKVEDYLRQLPPVKDKQNKEEIFQAIQTKLKDKQVQQSRKSKKIRTKTWFYPAIASIAAVFLILLILPSFLNDQQFSTEDHTNDGGTELTNGDSQEISGIQPENGSDEMGIAGITEGDMEGTIETTPEDGLNNIYTPIPKSVQVDKGDMIETHVFLVGERQEGSAFDSLEDNLFFALNSEEFSWSGVQSVSIQEDGIIATLDFSTENRRLESMSADEQKALTQAIQELFGFYGIEKVRLTTNGEPGVIYGQDGPLEDLPISYLNRGYYLFETEDGEQYLFRSVSVEQQFTTPTGDFLTFEQTIEKMKNVNELEWYHSPIPKDTEFDIIHEGDTIRILFSDGSGMEDTKEYELFVESMLLTATDFDDVEYLIFENIDIESVGPYQMGEYLSVENTIPNLNHQ